MDHSHARADATADRVPQSWHEPVHDVDDDWPGWVLNHGAKFGRPPRMLLYERIIRAHHGIASSRELVSAGVDETWMRMLRDTGRLLRLRKGWWALPGTAPIHVLAWRIGGPLACVSALVHHGLLTATEVAHASELHVGRATNSSRRLSAIGVRAAAVELGVPELGRAPVLHWSSRDFRSGTRLAVSVDTALEQARHCRPLLAAQARARAEIEQATT